MAAYAQDHEGITVHLPARWPVTPLGCLLLGFVTVSVFVGVGVSWWTMGVLSILTVGVLFRLLQIDAQRGRRKLRATSRRLTLTREAGPTWWDRPRSWSMLDIYAVRAAPHGLWLLPHPGPLDDIWLAMPGIPFNDLVRIAEALTDLARESEDHRGDYPTPTTRQIRQLTRRRKET